MPDMVTVSVDGEMVEIPRDIFEKLLEAAFLKAIDADSRDNQDVTRAVLKLGFHLSLEHTGKVSWTDAKPTLAPPDMLG